MKDPNGHRVELEIAMDKGKIDDLLKLAVRTDPPVMSGSIHLQTKFDLPPGKADVADRLHLAGKFQISAAYFSNDKIQGKIDTLSLRSQGKPKMAQKMAQEMAEENISDNVQSALEGTFDLASGLISLSQLRFTVPGTVVALTGTYSLDGKVFDFHGTARMDAKLSQMVTGWKSMLLKPVDPFFSKNGAGTEVPVKITGTESEPHFGVDFGHKDDASAIGKKP